MGSPSPTKGQNKLKTIESGLSSFSKGDSPLHKSVAFNKIYNLKMNTTTNLNASTYLPQG